MASCRVIITPASSTSAVRMDPLLSTTNIVCDIVDDIPVFKAALPISLSSCAMLKLFALC